MSTFAFFPTFYEDELSYSLFARYHIKSGNAHYSDTAKELFGQTLVNYETDFINALSQEALEQITKNVSIENVIREHTMFNQYARFIPREERVKAFSSLCDMKGNYSDLLHIQQKTDTLYLRYCPICCQNDRKRFGETYWHRKHQLRGIGICPIHHCKLHNSNVNTYRALNLGIISAELTANNETVEMVDDKIEIALTEYLFNLFNLPISLENDVSIGSFLHSKLENSNYLCPRGNVRKLNLLFEDIREYYNGTNDVMKNQNGKCNKGEMATREMQNKKWGNGEIGITEKWHLDKIFNSKKFDIFSICQLGMFLGINPTAFIDMKLPLMSQKELFDKKVMELHSQGIGCNKIGKMLGVSSKTVRNVLTAKQHLEYLENEPTEESFVNGLQQEQPFRNFINEPTEKQPRAKSGPKPKNWNQIDLDLLPLVKKAVNDLYGLENERPRKITAKFIQRYLGLSGHIFDHLPLYREAIAEKAETQEQFWIREIEWAVKKLLSESKPISRNRICNLINIEHHQLFSCLDAMEENEIKMMLRV